MTLHHSRALVCFVTLVKTPLNLGVMWSPAQGSDHANILIVRNKRVISRDRRCYLQWLFEAKKRPGLCVLNYMVTSNHVHLLVRDTAPRVIARSMQLIAGRTAQEYNQRKSRQGAFWEDRYHATAVETDAHLHRCLVYIDLNMVRAGVVRHPSKWPHGGYCEIQQPPVRYALIDLAGLVQLCGFSDAASFQRAHRQWVETALDGEGVSRDERWSEAVAVGGLAFVENVKARLGSKAIHRESIESDGTYTRNVTIPSSPALAVPFFISAR